METDKIVAAILASAWFVKQDKPDTDITAKYIEFLQEIKPKRNPDYTSSSR